MASVSLEKMANVTIDGKEVEVPEGTTVWEAARKAGISIPTLCHDPTLNPVGVCRVCAVEVEGAKTLAASCIRRAERGMVVRTKTPKIEASRKMLVELLLTDHPTPCARQAQTNDCELENLAMQIGMTASRFIPNATRKPQDNSSLVIAVDHSACILCDRCIRACDEIQCNEVIGRAGKGVLTRISFDNDLPMGKSSCVSCGECAAYCPTGALTDKPLTKLIKLPEAKEVQSVCPYCGVGCAINYSVQEDTIVKVNGLAASPGNRGRLCVKGRYGYDYSHHPERLTVPLIRKEGASKSPGAHANPLDAFREASWDEALDLTAKRFLEIKNKNGPKSLAGFGSAKCSVEEAYLFQKIIRVAFGNNNIDHCTRLCHAGSVSALMQTIGSAEVSNPFSDVLKTEVAIIAGSNPTENHPVAATFMKQAAKKGVKLIVMDPRRPSIANHATYYVQFKPGTDVALFNGMINVIINEGLCNEEFIEERTIGFEELKDVVSKYTPELAEKISGVPAETIRTIARLYGHAKRAMIFWGMGISQHTHGTENARCLISLALITGNIGRPGTGLHPLRGQNNVQGSSDMGLIPMFYPGYQPVEDANVRMKFEKAWGTQLDPNRGLTVVEIMSHVLEGKIKGMFMMGENPFLSDPNINKVKKALATMEFLVVQDIFLTETAEFADVILPASSFPEKEGTYTNTDRRVQLGHRAIKPPGQARPDWEILVDVADRMGLPMNYDSPQDIFEEMKQLTPGYAGITYERLEKPGGLVWPCPDELHPGTPVLHLEKFPAGRGKLIPSEFMPAKELPDTEYPFVLNTGRVLSHWHTGTMTRRATALNALEPQPFVEMNPVDMDKLQIRDAEMVRVKSRRGEIALKVRSSTKVQFGNVFIPFHYKEAAVNLLTIDALDPVAKIPEYKFCAVRIDKVHREEAIRSPA